MLYSYFSPRLSLFYIRQLGPSVLPHTGPQTFASFSHVLNRALAVFKAIGEIRFLVWLQGALGSHQGGAVGLHRFMGHQYTMFGFEPAPRQSGAVISEGVSYTREMCLIKCVPHLGILVTQWYVQVTRYSQNLVFQLKFISCFNFNKRLGCVCENSFCNSSEIKLLGIFYHLDD